MSGEERSTVRSVALLSWRDMRSYPSSWLLLCLSSLPLVFLTDFLVFGSPSSVFLLLLLIGYAVCYALHFIFWCLAVFRYAAGAGGEEDSGARAFMRVRSSARPVLVAGLFWGVAALVTYMAAQMVVSLVLSFVVAGGAGEGSLVALTFIHFYLSYLAADLLLVFLALVPQLVCLEGTARLEEAIRLSYGLVRERYGDSIKLFLIPELAVRTAFLGISFVIYYLPGPGLVFAVLLVLLSILEGSRTAFVAASFTRLYSRILEEKKKKSRAGGGKKKKKG